MALPAPDLARLIGDLRRTRALVTPEELAHRRPPVLPTGLGPLDRLLGGGLPQGRIVELAQGRGALGTAVALRLLARLTAGGRLAAVVDRADCFDPPGAARIGADLRRTLWCRPTTHRDAVRAADVLLASGAFALVILDLGARPAFGGRGPIRSLRWAEEGRPRADRPAVARGQLDLLSPPGQRTAPPAPGAGGPGGPSPRSTSEGDRPAPILIRTAPGEGAPPDEPRLERLAPGRKRRGTDADLVSQGAWLRLSRDAEASRTTLVVLGGEGAGTFAAASLRPVSCAGRFFGEGPGRTFEGLELVLALERNKLGLAPDQARIVLEAPELFPTGVRDPLPGAARVTDDPAASRRKAWWMEVDLERAEEAPTPPGEGAGHLDTAAHEAGDGAATAPGRRAAP